MSYIHLKLVQGVAAINRARAPLLASEKRLASTLATLDTRIAETQIAIKNAQAVGLQPVALKATLSGLESQRKSTESQMSSLSTQLLNLDAAKVVPPQLLAAAVLPKKPFSPQKTLIGLFGLVGGLVLGVIIAFIRDRFDDSLRGKADIEANFGAPVLAMVPKVSRWRRRKDWPSRLATPRRNPRRFRLRPLAGTCRRRRRFSSSRSRGRSSTRSIRS